jgi:glycosyltransferase involved in cell wall biosynthesis
MSLRLLLVAQQYAAPTSGLGTYARALTGGLVERGHDVTLAVPASQCAVTAGVRLVPMAFAPGNLTPFSCFRMTRAVRAVLAAEGARHDLVHFLDARETALVLAGGDARCGPLVGSIHDTYALDWRAPAYPRGIYEDRRRRAAYYAWLRVIERRAYRAAAALAANSRHVADSVARGYGVPQSRITVVPLGLPTPAPPAPLSTPAPPEPGERLRGSPAILFVGGNYQRKGLGTVLGAVVRLRATHPALHLHVVGADPHAGRFVRRATELGLGEAVSFHGWQESARVRSMMAAASVLAVPSLVEAFGLVYLEAMALGTPVVATRAGGTAEFFRDGDDALLMAPGDVGGLADAIGRIVVDGALRQRLEAGGRAAAARHSVGAMVAGCEALYARCS